MTPLTTVTFGDSKMVRFITKRAPNGDMPPPQRQYRRLPQRTLRTICASTESCVVWCRGVRGKLGFHVVCGMPERVGGNLHYRAVCVASAEVGIAMLSMGFTP